MAKPTDGNILDPLVPRSEETFMGTGQTAPAEDTHQGQVLEGGGEGAHV